MIGLEECFSMGEKHHKQAIDFSARKQHVNLIL